jgi:hypothetical protein
MFRIALVTVVASLAAYLSTPVTAAAAAPLPGTLPVTVATQPAKAKNLYFAYKVKITNGVP